MRSSDRKVMVAMIHVPDPEGPDFNKSYLVTRFIIGIIGLALAPVVILVDHWLYAEEWFRGSLSAYYHSGMREWFVGSLCAIGVGLFTYMGARPKSFDNIVSIAAGFFAIIFALFPTAAEVKTDLTPLQERLGEATVAKIHLGSAGLFVGLLGLICWSFGTRDGIRSDRVRAQRIAWKVVHRTCAVAIWGAILGIAITIIFDVGRYWTLVGEVVAVVAFALSWFFKGSELLSFFLGRDRFSTNKMPTSQSSPTTEDVVT